MSARGFRSGSGRSRQDGPPGAAAAPAGSGQAEIPPVHPSQLLMRARGIGKNFGATRALEDCDLEIRRGEIHALVGENGSGKSTLIKILSGVFTQDSGDY